MTSTRYRVERGEPSRDAQGNYHYLIYSEDQFVTSYWHDFRSDEQSIVFGNEICGSHGLPGRTSRFIEGSGGEPLELTKWAINYINECWP